MQFPSQSILEGKRKKSLHGMTHFELHPTPSPFSSLVLQNAKLLPLATAAVPRATLAAVSLAVKGVFGLVLFRGVEQEVAAAQGFGMVEEDVGFVLVHFAEDDDVGRVVLRSWSVR